MNLIISKSTMPCPFLSRYSQNNYGPFLSKLYSTHSKCPFLQKSPQLIKEVQQYDLISLSKEFNYTQFIQQQILSKKKEHSYRTFKEINRLAHHFPKALARKPVIVWCSNDYLGMSRHPEVKKAAKEAIEVYGTGAGGTRNISGTSSLHQELERRLARLHNKKAALMFTSCYVANHTTLSTLAKLLPGCHVFSDSGNHASMIQGIRHSGAQKHIYRHNDVSHLEELLSQVDRSHPKIVAFESVHSMTGSICPLADLCKVAKQHGALTFVDEVHAAGLYGINGAGIAQEHACDIDIVSGTLGKAYGNMGGYISADHDLIDFIRSYGSGFIFTTSLPPATVAGALKSIEILASPEGQQLRKLHQEKVHILKKKLQQSGFMVTSPSHIIPITIGNAQLCQLISDTLFEKGNYVQAINYPTVPRGKEMLRLAPTPFHDEMMMDQLVNELQEVFNCKPGIAVA